MDVPLRYLLLTLFSLKYSHVMKSHSQERAAYPMHLQEMVHHFIGSGRGAILQNHQ